MMPLIFLRRIGKALPLGESESQKTCLNEEPLFSRG
jgi:hypothetical protein